MSFGRWADFGVLVCSALVLLIACWFTQVSVSQPDLDGLVLSPRTWIVLEVPECTSAGACLEVGDQVERIGELDRDTFQERRYVGLLSGAGSGDTVEVVALRNGERFTTALSTARTVGAFEFLKASLFSLIFWLVGTGVALLVRPRSTSWLVLVALNYTTSVWLAAGQAAYFQEAGSWFLFHALIWLFLPILVHTHWIVPYPIAPRSRRWAIPTLYVAALVLVSFDLTGSLPRVVMLWWAGIAVVSVGVLLVVRLLRSADPAQRVADRVLFFGVIFGILPLAVQVALSAASTPGGRGTAVEGLANFLFVMFMPIWPLSYLYALSKYSTGPIQLRANRLLGTYGFFCVLVSAFVVLFSFGNYLLPTDFDRVALALALALVMITLAPASKVRFQKFVDRTIYGIKYLPEEIIGVFAARIPRAFDLANLRQVLVREVAPALMIRESALYVWNDEGRVEEVYRRGDENGPAPPAPSESTLASWAEQTSVDNGSVPDWVRFSAPLQGRDRVLGVWLLGRRDPDDLYPAADRELLNSIANQIAPVVENIRLVERAQHEVEENRKLQQQLIQSQKMEAIGRLSAGVAHDFNNLLSVILGYSSLLAVKYRGDDTLIGYLDDIRDAGDRAAALTRQLLAFSRQQVMEAKTVHLNHVVADVERILQRLTGEDVEVSTRLAENLPKVRIDSAQMGQVVMNLAVNARDAMPEGGTFELITEVRHLDEALEDPIQGQIPPGEYVTLTVADNGVGMPEDQLHRIFEPYFTTKELGKGTGLGLSMVYGIVSQFKGHIRVESEVGKGTAFSIFLPAQIGEESAVGIRSPYRVDESAGGSEAILVVEDEASVRHVACEILQAQGYRVYSASDGPEALEVYDGLDQSPDLLLTDVVMPQMKGTDLAAHLQRKQPDLQVVFMSGYNEESVFSGWRGDEEDRPVLIAKPFSPSSLLAEIRRQLDHEPRDRLHVGEMAAGRSG